MARIWELFRKQHKNATCLPLIIPMVLYHGERKWTVDKNFSGLFAKDLSDHLKIYLPDFEYHLNDISQTPDHEIKGDILIRAYLTLFKYIMSNELDQKLENILSLISKLHDKDKATEYIELMLRYVTAAANQLSEEQLHKSVTKAIIEGGQIMSTIAEKWLERGREEGILAGMQKGRQKGMQEGMQEGMQKGKRERDIQIAKKLIAKGIDLQTIAETTELSLQKIKRLAIED